MLSSRRSFIIGGLAASALPTKVFAEIWARSNYDPAKVQPSSDALRKFDRNGRPKSFKGNTLICHLPAQGSLRDAIAKLSNELRSASFASKLAVLPAASYHMTVFSGPTDQDRTDANWPRDLSRDATMERCNEVVGERFRAFKAEAAMPIRMRAVGDRMMASIHLVPADGTEAAKLRDLRDRLAREVFHFRDPKHDEYEFHISTAYQLATLTEAEGQSYSRLLARCMPAIVDVGVFELGLPEYCVFDSMARFDPVALMRT